MGAAVHVAITKAAAGAAAKQVQMVSKISGGSKWRKIKDLHKTCHVVVRLQGRVLEGDQLD